MNPANLETQTPLPPHQSRRCGRLASFKYASRGLLLLIKTQPNARIHLAISTLVTAAGIQLRISRSDWISVILAIGLVWTAEGLNTAIEFLTDRVSPEWSHDAARVKDVAAAAVLLAAIAAAAVGCLVFLPPVILLIEKNRQ